jgi:hypothetical protein
MRAEFTHVRSDMGKNMIFLLMSRVTCTQKAAFVCMTPQVQPNNSSMEFGQQIGVQLNWSQMKLEAKINAHLAKMGFTWN